MFSLETHVLTTSPWLGNDGSTVMFLLETGSSWMYVMFSLLTNVLTRNPWLGMVGCNVMFSLEAYDEGWLDVPSCSH